MSKKKKDMTLTQRFGALRELVRDAVNMEFNSVLVEEYQKQLQDVKLEIDEIAQQRKEFRVSNRK